MSTYPSTSARHWLRLAPLAVAALTVSQIALAAMPNVPGQRERAAQVLRSGQISPQSAQSAARASEAGRDSWQGKSLERLIIDHQRWAFSIPIGVSSANPAETGANCGLNQEGPVWNLLGPGGLPTFSVNCTVPAGKAIFMPAIGYFYEYPCTPDYPALPPGQNLEAFLRALTAEFIDGISLAQVTVDGKTVKTRRVATGMFSFTAAKDWVNYDACITGSPQVAQADGLWVLIDPLSVGTHTIKMNVAHSVYGPLFDGTWNIKVVR